MAGFALRFAHASNLRIDAPLRGTGPLPESARRIAEHAPATAWQRIVEACIDRDVAFLLLTPRTSVGEFTSFDVRTLLAGFRQLGEYEIPVYWSLAGGEALSEAMLDELPDNVTVLTDLDSTATLTREGRVVATFGHSPSQSPTRAVDRLAPVTTAAPPLRIRIADAAGTIDALPESGGSDVVHIGDSTSSGDYVACWGGTREQSRRVGPDLWVDPGSTCGRTADESSSGGINLVEWDGARISELLRVPTASVRWQCCLLGVSPETTHAEFVERLQFALLEQEPAIGEELWLIEWQIVGSGPEFDSLQSGVAQRELEIVVESVLGKSERLQRVHRWNLRRRGTNPTDDMSRRLREWLTAHAAAERGSISNEVGIAVRHEAVRDDAERLLAEWLSPSNG